MAKTPIKKLAEKKPPELNAFNQYVESTTYKTVKNITENERLNYEKKYDLKHNTDAYSNTTFCPILRSFLSDNVNKAVTEPDKKEDIKGHFQIAVGDLIERTHKAFMDNPFLKIPPELDHPHFVDNMEKAFGDHFDQSLSYAQKASAGNNKDRFKAYSEAISLERVTAEITDLMTKAAKPIMTPKTNYTDSTLPLWVTGELVDAVDNVINKRTDTHEAKRVLAMYVESYFDTVYNDWSEKRRDAGKKVKGDENKDFLNDVNDGIARYFDNVMELAKAASKGVEKSVKRWTDEVRIIGISNNPSKGNAPFI